MTKKILYITGTRADYGLMHPVLSTIEDHPGFSLELVVTGMHLMEEFGNTVDEIIKDGFYIHKIDAVYEEDNKRSMANFIGRFIQLLTEKLDDIKPDIILLLGDRAEMLAGAIVGAYMTIPVVHIHGGELTSTVDEFARHAITKLAHIHLTSTSKNADRIIEMGEKPENVFVVGAPGIDAILKNEPYYPNTLAKKYRLDLSKPFIMVIQHPVTLEVDEAPKQMRITLEAITELNLQTLIIYPNADAGGRKMIEVIKEFERNPLILAFKSIPHKDYLSLMKFVTVLIGNSSSGIIEAPSFGLPVINIGSRQNGRERAENVIDVNYDKEQIKEAIKKAISDNDFRNRVKKCINPYGDGKSSERIADILNKIKITPQLLQKRMTY